MGNGSGHVLPTCWKLLLINSKVVLVVVLLDDGVLKNEQEHPPSSIIKQTQWAYLIVKSAISIIIVIWLPIYGSL